MLSTYCTPGRAECQVVIRPNRSLTWRQSLFFIGLVSLLLFTVSGVFASLGYWLVLPFAGLEVLALLAATWWVAERGMDCEMVWLNATEVRVDKGRRACSRLTSRKCFPRAWVRIELRRRSGWYPLQLLIGASGVWVELGAFLADGEKQSLANELNRLLSTSA